LPLQEPVSEVGVVGSVGSVVEPQYDAGAQTELPPAVPTQQLSAHWLAALQVVAHCAPLEKLTQREPLQQPAWPLPQTESTGVQLTCVGAAPASAASGSGSWGCAPPSDEGRGRET